jgi:hypothetical protein
MKSRIVQSALLIAFAALASAAGCGDDSTGTDVPADGDVPTTDDGAPREDARPDDAVVEDDAAEPDEEEAEAEPDVEEDVEPDAEEDADAEPEVEEEADAEAGGEAEAEVEPEVSPEADGGELPGDTCGDAVAVAPGTLDDETTVGYTNDYTDGLAANGCTSNDSGLDRVYSITVPDGQRLIASVTSGDGTHDPSIYLVAGPATNCDASPRICLGADDSGGATTVNTVRYTNLSGAGQVVYIVIDCYRSTDEGGLFSLEVTLETPPPPPPGDTCPSAEAIAAGTLAGQTTVGFNNDYTGAGSTGGCTSADRGLDRVYSIAVPDGQRLTASVTAEEAGYDPSIYLIAAPAANCSAVPRVCLAADDSGGASTTNTVRYRNASGAEQTVFIVIDSFSSTDDGGTFTLATVVETPPPPPPGDVCSTAQAAAPGTLADQTTVGFYDDYNGGTLAERCTTSDRGLDRVYSIAVPDGQRLTASVTPAETGYNPSIYLVAAPAANCDADPRVCLAADDLGLADDTNTVRYGNVTGAEQTVFIVIDSGSTEAGGAFDLEVALAVPPPGEYCANAEPLAPGTLLDQTTVGYANDYELPGSCTGFATRGLDRVYSITVPAGQQLTVLATPAADYDVAIYLLPAPASSCSDDATCLAGEDSGGEGEADEVSWVNAGGAPAPVFVVVDCFLMSDPGGTYSLTVTIGPP